MKRLSPFAWVELAILVATILFGAAAIAHGEIPKIPGYVRVGDSSPSVYAPCAAVPYQPYVNPGTATGQFYYRYDASVMMLELGHGTQFAGQGGATHTDQYFGADGMIYPIRSGLHPPVPFPAPPPGANLCGVYQGAACPAASQAAYSSALARHPDWIGGIGAFKTIGHYAEDCLGQAPTAIPPTAGALTKSPTPRRTATPICCTVCPPGAPIPPCSQPTKRPTATATRVPVPPTPLATPLPCRMVPGVDKGAPVCTPLPVTPVPPHSTPIVIGITPTPRPKPWFAGCVAAQPTPTP